MREHHVAAVLATGAFAGASFGRSAPGRYRTRYEAHGRTSLERYLAEHAARLRKEMADAFPSGVEYAREEWEVLGSWPSRPG
jgi:hypothetical protein